VNDLRRRSVGAPAARSTLLTILGEYLLHMDDGAWQETLVNALNATGYKTHAARQAVARSVAAGWLRTERRGRPSRAYLTDETVGMLREGAERIFSFGRPAPWSGQWLLIVLRVPEEQREVRHRVRTQLAWAGFGSLGNGLWITPHVERERELASLARQTDAAEIVSFRAELGAIGEPARLMNDAWDLKAVAKDYRAFITRFSRLRPTAPEASFRAQTQLVHEWRKFPYLDPDLPEQMLPANWPRSAALKVFEKQHAAWNDAAQDYFRALDASVHTRAASAA
jgi:phenylacetic acid degradation operon negative regulatory protein